jgi:hypothetical protein
MNLKGSGEKRLHGGDVDFAVALAGVAVADLKERSFGVDGKEERRAGNQLLVVHVAGVHPRRRAIDPAGRLGRSDAHAAEERMKRNLESPGANLATIFSRSRGMIFVRL